jgi:putative ABC transport system permease protein
VTIDPGVLAFAALATLFCALFVGLVPALRLSTGDSMNDLRGEGRTSTTGASGLRMRSALMISEIALTTLLIAGTGLLVRSLVRLLDVNPGFDPAHVLTWQINFSSAKYTQASDRLAFFNRFSEEIRSLPGVRVTGAVSRLPLGEGNISTALVVEGRNIPDGNLPSIDYRIASDSYFTAMGIPLVEGRLADLRKPDELNINETAARRFWPGESAVGKRVKFGSVSSKDSWKTVAGVIGDVHHLGLEVAPRPEAYRPYIANPLGAPIFVVRSSGTPDALTAAVRERLRALDPEIPMYNVSTLEQLLSRSLETRRFSVALLAAFACVALLLAGIGLYGVVSYSVGLRTQEIGIRVALGAQRAAVVGMVLAHGLRMTLLGLTIGLGAALAIGPLFASLVFGISARDPIALLAGSSVLLGVALMACFVPARRAAKMDPLAALRG